MTGLFLLLVIGIWIAFISWLVPKIIQKIPSKVVRGVVGTVLFLFFLVLPLIDEIIGGFQFRALCKEGAVMNVDEEKAKNKVVLLKLSPGKNLSDTDLLMREQTWKYIDKQSGDVVFEYKTIHAYSGFFIKLLGISENDSPLIFYGSCGPDELKKTISNLNITVEYE